MRDRDEREDAKTRRSEKKMKYLLTMLFVLLVGVASAQQRPNIVVILADDMGYSDLGCFGGEIHTPNIDGLAKDGVKFTQFYNCARCCPSRACLLTGKYPHQVGIGAMIDGYAKWIRDAANSPSYQDHLSTRSATIAEMLRGAGYHTMMVGKWHMGERPEEWPVKRGFDRSFALLPGAMNYFGGETKGPRSPMALDDKPWVPPHDGFYSTDAFTDHAIGFVDEAAKMDKPFFLYMAYNAPHWPLQAPPEEIEKYKGKYDAGWQAIRDARHQRMIDLGIIDSSVGMAPMDRGKVKPWNELTDAKRAEWALRMSIYAAQIDREDQNIGRMLAELHRLKVDENTVIVFLSDNGGAAEDPNRGDPKAPLGTRDSFKGYARPWATVSNTPWRLHKTTAYEGGISTPLIVKWPEHIQAGTTVREAGHLIDLVPTCLAIAGTKAPNLEGIDLMPVINGSEHHDDRVFCWEHEGNRAIRKGNWKLVMLGSSTEGWELYDISNDRTEAHNLVKTKPEMVAELSRDYDAWAKRCGVVDWAEINRRHEKKVSRDEREEEAVTLSR